MVGLETAIGSMGAVLRHPFDLSAERMGIKEKI